MIGKQAGSSPSDKRFGELVYCNSAKHETTRISMTWHRKLTMWIALQRLVISTGSQETTRILLYFFYVNHNVHSDLFRWPWIYPNWNRLLESRTHQHDQVFSRIIYPEINNSNQQLHWLKQWACLFDGFCCKLHCYYAINSRLISSCVTCIGKIVLWCVNMVFRSTFFQQVRHCYETK